MDLRRLAHLVALAEERNFGRAAQRVHVTQPAFSRSVQAAEAELGMLLFDRGSPEVTCTPAGKFIVQRARKLLFDSKCLHRDIDLFRERQMGDIAFGVGPFPAATLLPPLATELRKRFPGVKSRVEVNNWKYLAEHVRAEELDFFVADVRDVPRDADLEVVPIGRQLGHFYVRKAHPLARRKSIKPTELVPFGIASVRLPAELRTTLRHLFALGAQDELPVALECDDVNLLKRIALQTDTVLATTDAAVRDEVKARLLHALTLQGVPPLYNEMGVVTLRGRTLSPMAEFAVDFMREAVRHQGRRPATFRPINHSDEVQGATMPKGEQRSNKMAKKPKKDVTPPREGAGTSDRPIPPSTVVMPKGKLKNKPG